MMRRVRPILLVLLIGGGALLLGLIFTTLRTGWIDPLDWLLPGTIALALFSVMPAPLKRAQCSCDGRSPGQPMRATLPRWSDLAIITLPPLILIALAATRTPWLGLALLVAGLVLIGLAFRATGRLTTTPRILAIGAILLVAWLAPRLIPEQSDAPTTNRTIAILSAMPLQGAAMGASQGLSPMQSVGLRSPLWRVLETRARLRALDAIDAASLAGVQTLMLAQPRALQPAELVALDAWVRRGGRAVILADPLLHWPDPRPLGSPLRAPLTSLLDPLLAHWGLRLEAAEQGIGDDPVERRALASGALLQLAGASRFVHTGKDCLPEEDGLVVRCRIGAGQALLVADADFIDDSLWTMRPEAPLDRRDWTSDAPDQLAAWLLDQPIRVARRGAWLAGPESLVMGLRAALLVLLGLAIARSVGKAFPRLSQAPNETHVDQRWNKAETEPAPD